MALLFKQITVCGVGLIGGSLALIARRRRLAGRIVGLGRSQKNLAIALRRGIVDAATRDPEAAARGADLVVLAVPVRAMPRLLRAMVPYLPADAVITDVGSTKGWLVRELEPLLGRRMALVGAHPVAGDTRTGAGAADPTLFRDRRVIITPSARSTPQALKKVERMWRTAGARVERIAPETHDKLLARASHLPQIVASALAAALEDERVGDYPALRFGAGGLADTTRIAASAPEMWRDICLTNRAAILGALRLYGRMFEKFSRSVERGDARGLEALFERGVRMREKLERSNGAQGRR